MPHVVWLFEFPTLNGGEHSLLASLEAVRAAGFRVTAWAPPRGPLAQALAAAGIEVSAFETRDANGGRPAQLELRARMGRMLDDQRPDLLHANSLAMGRLAGPAAAALGICSIAHLRDIVGLSAAAIADLNCNFRLLAVSEAVRSFHAAQGLAADRMQVLYNGVDLSRFHPLTAPAGLRRSLSLPAEALVIGSIGQLIVRKGWDVLIAAANRLADELPQAQYVIVGERYSEKAEAQAYVADLELSGRRAGLAGRVHWLGRRDDVEHLLAEFDLLVHPARQEPLGRVLLEAAAAGRAIVCTAVGGTPEIFPGPDTAARLVPPDDVDSLATSLRDLATDPQLRLRLGQAARHRAEHAFDIRRAANQLAQHYRDVICHFV